MNVSMEFTAVTPTLAQPQCHFFVVRKKRLCRMTVKPGRQYCGEHEPQPLIAEEQEIDKRVPCPNDPKHTCYISKLEKHLAKCNARQVADPPYIVRNINAPEEEDSSPRIHLKDVPVGALQLLIEKVNVLYDRHVKSKISTYNPPAKHHAAVADCIAQVDRANSSRRHLRQASRLMQLAEDEGLVADGTCYVELGAGKGMLSYYMGRAWCEGTEHIGSSILCVDRASLRHKQDNRLTASAARLRADLRHLALELAPPVAQAPAVVGVAKHLCGVATDYALRCMSGAGVIHKSRGALVATCCHHRCERAHYVGRHTLQKLGISDEELNIIFGIVSWATCGDGRSRERRLAQNGLHSTTERDSDIRNGTDTSEQELSVHYDVNEFDRDEEMIESKIDTNQPVPDKDGNIKTTELDTKIDHEVSETDLHKIQVTSLQLPVNIREEIGRKAKALLDYGRVLYLREKGFQARLCYYVPTTESLENVCIVAKKDVTSNDGS